MTLWRSSLFGGVTAALRAPMPVLRWRSVDLRQSTIFSRLRGLLEVTRLVRTGEELPELLARDRAHGLRLARLPHGGRQSLPPRVGRLRRQHRVRERRGTRGAARPGPPVSTSGSRCSTSASCSAARTSSPPVSSTGTQLRRLDVHPRPPGAATTRTPWHPDDALFAPLRGARRLAARRSSPSTSRSPDANRAATRSTCSSRCPSTRRSRSRRRRRLRARKANREALERLLDVSTHLNETWDATELLDARLRRDLARRSASRRSRCSC